MQIFRPVLFLVWAAEGKTGLLFGAFIIGFIIGLTSTMSTIKLCGIKAFFGIFLETNKHQNLTRLVHPNFSFFLSPVYNTINSQLNLNEPFLRLTNYPCM